MKIAIGIALVALSLMPQARAHMTSAGSLGCVDKPDPDSDRSELNEAEEGGREFVVAGSDAA